MSDFDLSATVKDVLAEGGCDSFREYAAKVVGRIPKSEVNNVLMATLPDYIRNVDHRAQPIALTPGSHASRRVQAIGTAWTAFLARHITTDAGTQIRLADATEEQVRFYAGLLRVKAREVSNRARNFADLADLMRKQNVKTVRDLPAEMAADLVKAAA